MSATAPGASRPQARRSAWAPPDQTASSIARPGRSARRGADVARPLAQPLRIFELAQLGRDADADIGVGADAEAPAGAEVVRRIEDAVAEIGLGDRTEAGDRAASAPASRVSPSIHVGRVDEAPVLVDARMVEEPPHRPRARPGDAVLDFLDLLGDVDVDRTVAGQGRRQFGKFARGHGAQAVRRDADRLVSVSLHQPRGNRRRDARRRRGR